MDTLDGFYLSAYDSGQLVSIHSLDSVSKEVEPQSFAGIIELPLQCISQGGENISMVRPHGVDGANDDDWDVRFSLGEDPSAREGVWTSTEHQNGEYHTNPRHGYGGF